MSSKDAKRRGRPTTLVLGNYKTGQGARRLYGRHKGETTYLTDEPVSGRGVIYPVETIPDTDGPGAIKALANLYLEQARELGASPMAYTALDPDLQAADLLPDFLWAAA
jgi:hypothetical protein